MGINVTPEAFAEFKKSRDTLWICYDNECAFKSDKGVLAPLIEYISKHKTNRGPVIIYDRVMGNAAALLSVIAGAGRIYSPLGSALATKTLDEHGIEYHLENVVPFILARDGKDICPMEKLSQGKDPEEFYNIVSLRFGQGNLSAQAS